MKSNGNSFGPTGGNSSQNGGGAGDPIRHGEFCACFWCLMGHS